ncbi:unnamed protein product [Camellia sinensis]
MDPLLFGTISILVPNSSLSSRLTLAKLLNSTLNWNCFQPVLWANNCIKHAVELEQSFMEGAYNRVLSARQTVPHETYVYFMICWQRQSE